MKPSKTSKLAPGLTPDKAKRRPGGGEPSPVKKLNLIKGKKGK